MRYCNRSPVSEFKTFDNSVLYNYYTEAERVIYTRKSYHFLHIKTSQVIFRSNQLTSFKNDANFYTKFNYNAMGTY